VSKVDPGLFGFPGATFLSRDGGSQGRPEDLSRGQSIPMAMITTDQRINALAPQLLILYQFSWDSKVFLSGEPVEKCGALCAKKKSSRPLDNRKTVINWRVNQLIQPVQDVLKRAKYEDEEEIEMFRWHLARDPIWAKFGRIQRHLDDLARHMGGATRSPFEHVWRPGAIFPALNVTKTDNSYVVTAEIPGMHAENLDIKVEGDTLTLKGERKPENLGEGVSYHRKERASGMFQRSLTLPSNVEPDGVKANYEDGALTITLPVAKSVQPKQIAITT
jgi:HSP20 family protein